MFQWKLLGVLAVSASLTFQAATADEGKKPASGEGKPKVGGRDGDPPKVFIKNGRTGGTLAKIESNQITVETRGEGADPVVKTSTVYALTADTVIMIDGQRGTIGDLKPETRVMLQLGEDSKSVKALKVFTGNAGKDGGPKPGGERDGVKKPGGERDGVKKPGGENPGVKKPGGEK